MSVSWEFRGELLVVTEVGVSTNAELDRAFVHEALTDLRARRPLGSVGRTRIRDVSWILLVRLLIVMGLRHTPTSPMRLANELSAEPEPLRRAPTCPDCRKPLKSASVLIRQGTAFLSYRHTDGTSCDREQAAEQLDPSR